MKFGRLLAEATWMPCRHARQRSLITEQTLYRQKPEFFLGYLLLLTVHAHLD